ncbi:uncharacterized protein LOC111631345 [Centruroides sculpturatus]|uniref:uncharacterized protein LOC111631339 n=1 Tax=Centruroides sculpturatus TaxID=218467 RepID=UPI000C6D6FA7|nr:uncharacterized protein LOC111631339 [Centruroides sculpturatus]XP_023231339.1 uncharacterized protein LOC111631345 [Centruroides sculpturatus]
MLSIGLPGSNETFTNGLVKIVGWETKNFEHDTNFLQVAEANLMDPQSAARQFGKSITGEEIVAVPSEGKVVKGEYGSSLIFTNKSGKQILIGILTNPSNSDKEPDIYLSTSVNIDFINRYRCENVTCV